MRRWLVPTAVGLLFVAVTAADEKPQDRTSGRAHNRPKADPEATRLFTEARAARALWKDFPGFSADAEVNLDGKVSRGKVRVDRAGKVTFENLDHPAEAWAKGILTADVGHRLDAGSESPSCSFADDEANHPLGRAVVVIGDSMGSNYRIRERQIVVVNRKAGKTRFSITLLESRFNKEGKYLPGSFIVHHWDADTGELRRTDSYNHTWKRVDAFDLPVSTRVVTTSREVSARSLTLSNHKLAAARD